MKTMGRELTTLVLATAACLAASCGVGPYHIPNVEPVVKPEPEEDIFADMELDEGSPASADDDADEEPPKEKESAPAAATPDEAPPSSDKDKDKDKDKPSDAAVPPKATKK